VAPVAVETAQAEACGSKSYSVSLPYSTDATDIVAKGLTIDEHLDISAENPAQPTRTEEASLRAEAGEGASDGSPGASAVDSDSVPAFARLDGLILAAVVLVALVIRVIYVLQVRSSPLFSHPILDSEVHDGWARAIVAGKDIFTGAYFKAPLYPWFLAAVYKLGGPGYLVPRLVQAVMGSLSCGLVYLVGREAFGRATGALAGLAAATFWVLVYFDAELLLEPLSVFLNLLALWLILRAARRGTGLSWLVAGLVLGLSAINRPNVLVFMPLVALWIVFIYRARLRLGLLRAAVFGVGCSIPILPITIRNWVVGHDFVLIASQAGPNFYIGNNPESDGMSARVPGARTSWFGGFQDWTSLAEQETGRKLKPSEVSKFFFEKAWDFMRHRRRAALNLMLAKFQLFFYEWEIPNNKDLFFFTKHYTPIAAYLPLRSGMVLSLGVVGLLLSLGRARRLFPLWAFAVVYSATVIAFFVCSRFRVPVMPMFILFAAYFVVRWWRYLKAKDWGAAAGWGIVAYLAWAGVNRGVPDQVKRMYEARSYCQVGVALAQEGRLDAARAAYRQALEVDPQCTDAEVNLGHSALQQNNFDEAIRYFRDVLKNNPGADVHEHLAKALGYKGRWGEAIEVLRTGLAAYPGYLDLKRKLAFVLATCPIRRYRDGSEAVRLAESVRDFGSEIPETYDTLGVAYAEVGRFGDAIAAARHALRLAQAAGIADAAEQITARLSLYGRGRAFRQSLPASR